MDATTVLVAIVHSITSGVAGLLATWILADMKNVNKKMSWGTGDEGEAIINFHEVGVGHTLYTFYADGEVVVEESDLDGNVGFERCFRFSELS